MIEYMHNFITAMNHDWQALPNNVQYNELKFRFHRFKIDNVIYKDDTPEFKQAFQIERTWKRLTQ